MLRLCLIFYVISSYFLDKSVTVCSCCLAFGNGTDFHSLDPSTRKSYKLIKKLKINDKVIHILLSGIEHLHGVLLHRWHLGAMRNFHEWCIKLIGGNATTSTICRTMIVIVVVIVL